MRFKRSLVVTLGSSAVSDWGQGSVIEVVEVLQRLGFAANKEIVIF